MNKFITLLFLTTIICSCQKVKKNDHLITLKWEMGSNNSEDGTYTNTFTLYNNSDSILDSKWAIYYNQLPRTIIQDSSAPLKIKIINGDFFCITPTAHYKKMQPGDSIVLPFVASEGLIKESHAPRGAYIIKNNIASEICNIPIEVIPFTKEKQWTRPQAFEPPYPSGEYIFKQNQDLILSKNSVDHFDILPSLKSIKKDSSLCTIPQVIKIEADDAFKSEAELLENKLTSQLGAKIDSKSSFIVILEYLKDSALITNDEFYRLEIKEKYVKIQSRTAHGIFNGTQTLLSLLKGKSLPKSLSSCIIEDYPDLEYRGQMIDIARNFMQKEHLKKLIDIFASYKLNAIHLHITDDEGWRIEIDGLEELTSVGARRGHTDNENECLYPAYGSGYSPTDLTSPGNGYYSKEDFIEILRYAKKRHVKIITELDFPGHSRAAIVAMKARYNKYKNSDMEKAKAYLLNDFDDASVYKSAQFYTDNVLCVALPSVYNFVDKVTSEVVNMYLEADAPLTEIHIGGDEVPEGAWSNSGICKNFMKDMGMKQTSELRSYFLHKVIDIFKKYNLKMAGWQEVGLTNDNKVNSRMAGNIGSMYCWNTVPEWHGDVITYQLANGGFDVILSNVNNLYFDLSYNKHPKEPGLHWGGFVNEISSFNMQPYQIYRSARTDMRGTKMNLLHSGEGKEALEQNSVKRIKGIQGQLWCENIFSHSDAEYALFPKMFGLFERGWNACPEWSIEKNPEKELEEYQKALQIYYAKIVSRELPHLAKMDINFRINQPGISTKNNLLIINHINPEAELRFTFDGSEPSEESEVWTKPVNIPASTKEIKAKAYIHGKESCTSIMKAEDDLANRYAKSHSFKK